MSSQVPLDDVARLVTMFNSEIKVLLDDLRCGECGSVLTDACQLACGCRFCRTCIDNMSKIGAEFCPGSSNQCGATTLSTALPDYNANRTISRLTAKCAQSGCTHEFLLDDMRDHSLLCQRNMVDCPFREWECLQDKLAAGGMSGHSDILSGFVANINKDIEMLKRELKLNDERGEIVENEIKLMRNQIKSIEKGNESIKEEKEVLADRARQLSEKLELEMNERTNKTEITEAIISNRALSSEMELVRNDIQSIQVDIACMKAQKQQVLVQLGPDDTDCDDWVIPHYPGRSTRQGNVTETSGNFWKGNRPHCYQMALHNYVDEGELRIYLRIWASPTDAMQSWPFKSAITINIAQSDKREVCCRQTRQFEIRRPANYDYSSSNPFVFPHSAFSDAGLDLEGGVRVWCGIRC